MDKQIAVTKVTKAEIVLSQAEIIDAIIDYIRRCSLSKYHVPHEATVKLSLARRTHAGPDYEDFEEGDNLSLYWESEEMFDDE